jgi:hypothetical protein
MRGRSVAVHGGFSYKGFLSRRPVGCASTSLPRAHGRTLSNFRRLRRVPPGISTVSPRHLKPVLSAIVQQIVDEDVEKERGCGVALSQSTVDSYTRGS